MFASAAVYSTYLANSQQFRIELALHKNVVLNAKRMCAFEDPSVADAKLSAVSKNLQYSRLFTNRVCDLLHVVCHL